MTLKDCIPAGVAILATGLLFGTIVSIGLSLSYVADSFEISPSRYGQVEWNRQHYPFSESKIKEALLDGCITIREYNGIDKFIEVENTKNNKLNLIKRIAGGCKE